MFGGFFVLVFVCIAAGSVAPGPSAKEHPLKAQLQELMRRLKEIKEPIPVKQEVLKHASVQKPTDADKHVPVELRLQRVLDSLKVLQGQQMILGSALHNIMDKVREENEQIDDQQQVLGQSFAALFENVATRQDIEEVVAAAGEDNEVHVELEETSKKIEEMQHHIVEALGHPNEDGSSFTQRWTDLENAVHESSVASELQSVGDIAAALRAHATNSHGQLFYFVIVNVVLLLAIILWRKSKGTTYAY